MSAAGRTLIGNPVSPYVRKILAICALKGVEVAVDPVTPFRGDDAFAALSPLRRVPVWIEGSVSRRRSGWKARCAQCRNRSGQKTTRRIHGGGFRSAQVRIPGPCGCGVHHRRGTPAGGSLWWRD